MQTLSIERLGKFTASKISDLFPGERGGIAAKTKYIQEKAEELVKGRFKEFNNKHTDHGKMHELEAINTFKEVTGLNIVHCQQEFIKINDFCGATPDAKVVDFTGKILASVDVKCPTETFFAQKLLFVEAKKKNEKYQFCPKEYFYQGQMQMMALNVDKHYLVRYLTNKDVDFYGETIEYDLPLEIRLFYQVITADKAVQDEILNLVTLAAIERDILVKIFKTPIL